MKYPNIVAACILGASLIIGAVIIYTGLTNASNELGRHMVFPPPPSFPDAIVVRSGNERFRVDAATPDPYNKGDAFHVKVTPISPRGETLDIKVAPSTSQEGR